MSLDQKRKQLRQQFNKLEERIPEEYHLDQSGLDMIKYLAATDFGVDIDAAIKAAYVYGMITGVDLKNDLHKMNEELLKNSKAST